MTRGRRPPDAPGAKRGDAGRASPVSGAAPPGEPTVRRARPEDLDLLARLEQRTFADPWSRTVLAGSLASGSTLALIAEPAEPASKEPGEAAAAPPAGPSPHEPLGHALFQVTPPEAELLRIGVVPAERRRGLAHRLLAAGRELLAERGVTLLHLEVRTGNPSALALYRAHGFRVVGERRAYYADGEDALILSLRLERSSTESPR